MVTAGKTLGCIEKVYESVENMKETYLIANINKSILLHPEKIEGFVKQVSTYIITDNLKVMSKTTVFILFLIKKLGVKDSPLKEKVVVIGKEHGIALLEASL
ncbi:hypothetical protein KSP40_PGU018706 [Platanthera guangdongensis]|uniref:Uncharacterized protein n=1 Tax=Platanthera guangdongensis TaxID=2320717 RepID=A0ABR2MQ69_9ASPA